MEKTKKIKKPLILFMAMIMGLSFIGCQDKVFDDQGKGDITNGEANDFDFSMKMPVEFSLKYDVPSGYQVQFELYTTSPLTLDSYKSYVKDANLVPFMRGRSDEGGRITFKGDLPATVSEIYAYSTAIGVPVLMKASVNNGIVSEFTNAEVPTVSTRASGSGPSGTNTWKTYNVVLSKPTLPSTRMDISTKDMNLIDISFPEDRNYDIVKSYYRPSIQLNEKARVKIYSVKHGANSDRTNALAYFVYKNDDSKPDDVNSTLQLAFPELTKTVPARGEGYQLLDNGQEVFEAGSRIGFALFPDITPNNIKTTNAYVLYSCFDASSWNAYTYPDLSRAGVPHMVLSLLRKDADGHAIIAVGFEDQPWAANPYGTNRGNFRDDIFIIEVDPATSLPDDLPGPPTDQPAYDIEIPSSGILSFEDNWPHAGDYDINDVVIAYDRALLYSYKNGLVGLKEKFTLLNDGATFTNGFGYQLLGVSQKNVTKCTVQSEYKWDGQGLDTDASSNEAIIMLFDNTKLVKKGTTFDVTTYFSLGTLMNGVNPFIVVKKGDATSILLKERTEVHLPTTNKIASSQFLPTSKASKASFGQYEDKSDLTKGVYYVRSSNYPFALDINWECSKYGPVTNFVISKEGQNFDKTYPKFIKWVTSKGTTDKDWYLYPNK